MALYCPKCGYPRKEGGGRYNGTYAPFHACAGCGYKQNNEPVLCKHCGKKPLAYPGAIYCGAACCARAEAHEPAYNQLEVTRDYPTRES